MSLEPKFKLSPYQIDASIMIVSDITGDYSSDNPGGYGTPNQEKSWIHWNYVLKVKTKGKALEFDQETKIVFNDPDDPIIDESNGVAYSKVDVGGQFILQSYGSLLLSQAVSPTDGEIFWDDDQQRYVIINSGLPQTIAFEDIDPEAIAFTVTTQTLYPFEINKKQAQMLEVLPATDSCAIEKWMEEWSDIEKDAQTIKIYSCRKFYNSALLILAKYQNKIVIENC